VSHPVTGARTLISGSELHHLRSVLRLGPGDHLVVSDPSGTQFAAVLETVRAEEATARIIAPLQSRGVQPITLFQAILKGPKMELVLQKATELGVAEIVPLEAERNVVRLDGQKVEAKLERWKRIAIEASKQSGRASPPAIGLPVTPREAASRVAGFDTALVFWEEAREVAPVRLPQETAAVRVAVFIGPEGGLTSAEVEMLESRGATRAGLGPLTLRSETAAIAALAIVAYEMRRGEATARA